MVFHSATLAVLLAGFGQLGPELAAPEIPQIEQQVLDYRTNSFRDGFVRLVTTNEGPAADPDLEVQITFAADSIRIRRAPANEDAVNSPVKTFILTKDEYLSDRAGHESGAYAGPRSDYTDPRASNKVFHPRELGLDVNTMASIPTHGMTFLLGRSDRQQSVVTEDLIEGQVLTKVSYTRFDMAEVELWIDATKGPSLVAATTRKRARDKLYEFSVQIVLSNEYGLWYPKRIEQKGMIDGNLYRAQNIEVLEARFNVGVDPREFDIAGLQLNPGTRIRERRNGRQEVLMWDGQRALSRSQLWKEEPVQSSAAQLWIGIGCLLLLVAGLIAAIRYRGSKRVAN